MPSEKQNQTPADRLLSIMLQSEKLKDGFHISKKQEQGSTVIQIVYMPQGKRSEEHVCRVISEV